MPHCHLVGKALVEWTLVDLVGLLILCFENISFSSRRNSNDPGQGELQMKFKPVDCQLETAEQIGAQASMSVIPRSAPVLRQRISYLGREDGDGNADLEVDSRQSDTIHAAEPLQLCEAVRRDINCADLVKMKDVAIIVRASMMSVSFDLVFTSHRDICALLI